MSDRAIRATRLGIILIAAALGAGCASSGSKPIIDPDGVDMGRYQNDLAQCQQIAEQVEQKAASGAVGGALIGGVIGAITGNSDQVRKSAGVGGVLGGAKGAAATRQEKSLVVKNCLRSRGYTVLN
ncbi:MAG: glycine zipper family protein [Gammaproteobacteria bacterium]|nr:glycine zipper family protein [Gammaproteobacteria bacterium]MDH3537763.1 glycine zipper family protein [Gammaproteobacteria bacterium]